LVTVVDEGQLDDELKKKLANDGELLKLIFDANPEAFGESLKHRHCK